LGKSLKELKVSPHRERLLQISLQIIRADVQQSWPSSFLVVGSSGSPFGLRNHIMVHKTVALIH